MKCSKCGSKENLFINARKGDRKYYRCRKCNTEKMKDYRKTAVGSDKIYQAIKAYMKKDGYIKQYARLKLGKAVRSGALSKPDTCSVCSSEKQIFGHHEDYSQPLAVIWVCRNCHQDIHNKKKTV